MDAEDDSPRGRRVVRRARNGFAFSNASINDSTASEGGTNLNAQVETLAAPPEPQVPPQTPESTVVAGNPSEEFNPSARLAQVRSRATQYEREYRLKLLHRLMMRNIPMDEIAAQLGISIAQVYRDREELKKQLRADAGALHIDEIIGDSKGFYEEVSAMAMRAASNSNQPMPMRLAAMRTGLAAKNDMHRFFQTTGVYDVLRFRVAQDGTGVSDVRRLMENTERILSGEGLGSFEAGVSEGDTGNGETLEL
jgi:phosphatidylglycerophosphatase A